MGGIFWIGLGFFVLVGVLVVIFLLFSSKREEATSVYQRRKFLMDSNAEFGLFKVLVELYSDKYYIFPQIHYSSLIEPKPMEYRARYGYLSKINKKSADFVLCDKLQVVHRLVIELDGPTHSGERVKARDLFINRALEDSGLPVLHISVGPYTPESIKVAVDAALTIKES